MVELKLTSSIFSHRWYAMLFRYDIIYVLKTEGNRTILKPVAILLLILRSPCLSLLGQITDSGLVDRPATGRLELLATRQEVFHFRQNLRRSAFFAACVAPQEIELEEEQVDGSDD